MSVEGLPPQPSLPPSERERVLDMMKKRQERGEVPIKVEVEEIDEEGLIENGQEENISIGDRNLDETINFNDLPISWREHIEKRKEEGFLAKDKNTFTKQEILEATADPNSYTPPERVDKLFARAKKEKINFSDLPLVWQEKLKAENIFGDMTLEYLRERGARPEDIDKIQEQVRTRPFVLPEEKVQSKSWFRRTWGSVKNRFGWR